MAESWRYQQTSRTTSVPSPPSLPQHEPTAMNERLQSYTPTYYTNSEKNISGNNIYKTELVLNKTPTSFVSASSTKPCQKCRRTIDLSNNSEIIFNDRSYHKDCFQCAFCNKYLDNEPVKTFAINANGDPICSKCKFDNAKTCTHCHKPIVGEKSIAFDGETYHASCFQCGQCRKPLADEKDLFKQNGKPWCATCFDDKFAERCVECSKPIITGKTTVFDTKKYHPQCFRCGQCRRVMADQEFYTRDGKPCCDQCYKDRFAERCTDCRQLITDGKSVLYKQEPYHPDCIRCGECQKSLAHEQRCHTANGKPCCEDCYLQHFTKRCAACRNLITDRNSTIYQGESYHDNCFRCGQCNKVMVEREFRTHDGKPCCDQCYKNRFAENCAGCRRLITDGKSILYNQVPYHAECIRCGQCNKSLAQEQRCYTENGKPCCDECYLQRFAKRCAVCRKVIADQNATIYQGESYHPDCFRCGQCNKVMVEREFHTHAGKPCCNQCFEERIAPRCAQCHEPINKEYSTFQGKNYHPHCFICIKCRRMIGGKEKFYNEPSGFLCTNCDAQRT